jgi:hypothetical protein
MTSALHNDGMIPLIYGERGLGKSSLAIQGERIALGDTELLDRHGTGGLSFAEDQFLVEYVSCTQETRNTDGLLKRIARSIVSREPLRETKPKHELVEKTIKLRVKLMKVLEAENSRLYKKVDEIERLESSAELQETVRTLLEELARAAQQRVLVIVDELDLLEDTRGLAGFLKVTSSRDVRFILVGIAEHVDQLLDGHRSIERKIRPLLVPEMDQDELEAIVTRAVEYLSERNVICLFNNAAKRYLAASSFGFPFFVHAIGEDAVLAAAKAKGLLTAESAQQYQETKRGLKRTANPQVTVGFLEVDGAMSQLSRNEFARQYELDYVHAVGESASREMVLRSFALQDDPVIPIAPVYKVLRDGLDLPDPSKYKSQLCSPELGAVLRPVASRKAVRFGNRMFRNYVNIRTDTIGKTRDEVLAAWKDASRTASIIDETGSYRRGSGISR